MASWQARVVRRVFVTALRVQRMAVAGDVEIGPETPEQELERYALGIRERFEAVANYTPQPDWASHREAEAPTGGLWVESERSDPDRYLLHLHGGAYLMGSPETHRGLGATLARVGRTQVYLPRYRLAPEHRFPAAVEDAMTAYRWMLEEAGADPARLAVSGDSAGGGLALAMLCEARDEGLPLPACYVGLSPWVDLAGTGDSITERDARDPWLDGRMIVPAGRGYAGETPLDHPRVSPLYADLSGLPPMLVHAGTDEVLYDDGRRIVERARAAGVDASFGEWQGMWHVFQAFPGIPESRWALREIGAFIRRHTGVEQAESAAVEGPTAA